MLIEFDGSFNGFLSLIYDWHYNKSLQNSQISIQDTNTQQLSFFEEKHVVETCETKAEKVYDAINKKISNHCASVLYNGFLFACSTKYLTLLQYINLGFKVGHMVDSHLQEPFVLSAHKMAKEVGMEAHLLFGFSRFVETDSGVFYSHITPKNNVLPLVAEHFANRFMNQQWVIHDKLRNQAAIYNGQEFLLVDTPPGVTITFAPGEEDMQKLWKSFLKALTIESRLNPKLQRQLLPLRYRHNMTEFTN